MTSVAILTLLLGAHAGTAQQPPASPPPAAPTCTAPEHRQFDFWLGDWDVVPNGAPPDPSRKPSHNAITTAHDGCVVLEHYTAGAYSGRSINIYDRSRGQWHQTWVDSTGALHEYWGSLHGANLVFRGSTPARTDPALRMEVRLTFFNQADGTVRQLSERLNADGTWSVNYDLLYTRRR